MCGVTNDNNNYEVWNPSVGIYHKAAADNRLSFGGILGAVQDKQVENTLTPKAYPKNFAGLISAIQDLRTGTYEPSVYSSNLEPAGPHLEGQLWFNRNHNRLFVYLDDNWVQTNGSDGMPILSETQPSAEFLLPGQLWFNSTTEVLYIFTGEFIDPATGNTVTAYSANVNAVWKPINGNTSANLQTDATLPLAIALNELTGSAYLPDIDLAQMNNQKDFNEWIHGALTALNTGLSGFQSVATTTSTHSGTIASLSSAIDAVVANLDASISTERSSRESSYNLLSARIDDFEVPDNTQFNSLEQDIAAVNHRVDLIPQYDLSLYASKTELETDIQTVTSQIAALTAAQPDLSGYQTTATAQSEYQTLLDAINARPSVQDVDDVEALIPDVSSFVTQADINSAVSNLSADYLPRTGGALNGSLEINNVDITKPGIDFGNAANGTKGIQFQTNHIGSNKVDLGTTSNFWELAWNFNSLEDFCWVYNNTDKVFSITKDGPACSTILLGDIGANNANGRIINNVVDVKSKLSSHDTDLATHTQQISNLTSAVNTSQAGVYYSDSAPTVALNDGALWFDSQNLRLNVRHGGVWVFPDRVEDTALKAALLNAVNTSTDYASLKTNLIAALS